VAIIVRELLLDARAAMEGEALCAHTEVAPNKIMAAAWLIDFIWISSPNFLTRK
jgi:hypothetical protein